MDSEFTWAVRGVMLAVSVALFVIVFGMILISHWRHHRTTQTRFHGSTLTEMAWSSASMLIVLVTGIAGISSVSGY